MSKEKKATSANRTAGASLFTKAEEWLKKNDGKFFYSLLFISLLLSLMSFNARISEAHDDALYLEGGWRFVHEFPNYFYTQNAPLYPLFLGLLVKIMGFKLIVFKLFSVVFNLLGLALFYKALRNHIPALVFIPVIIFHAANHLIHYYASMTFTEAFYFFLQGLLFYYAALVIRLVLENKTTLKEQLKYWIMLGLSMFLISTCKSSAIVLVLVAPLFFALIRNFKAAGISVAAYLAFKIPYEILVKAIWNSANQFKGQSKILLQKDPYNASMGEEDMAGFVTRFIENCDLYLSRRFYQLLGFLDDDYAEQHGFLAFLTLAFCVIGFILLYKKKNHLMVFLTLFIGAQTVLSFIILQTRWDQARIILINMPVLLICIFYVFWYFMGKEGIWQTVFSALCVIITVVLLGISFEKRSTAFLMAVLYVAGFFIIRALSKKAPAAEILYMLLVIIIAGSQVISSFKRGYTNLPIVMKNLKGDKYYGYTPDWVNFLKCSEWCADSLGENSLVASRKAPMSFVYGKGKKFFPVYSVVKLDTATSQSNPDSALAYFKKNKVTHIMVAKLRVNPKNPDDGFINTIHNILQPIERAYPNQKLKLIHKEGDAEETEVYQFIY